MNGVEKHVNETKETIEDEEDRASGDLLQKQDLE